MQSPKLLQSMPLRVVCFGLLLLGLLVFVSRQAAASLPTNPSPDSLWQDADEAGTTGERQLQPDHYRVVALDTAAMQSTLDRAPMEFTEAARNSEVVIHLPLPDGGYGRFRIVQSPIMAPELAAKFPWMKTYAGRGLDDVTATVRLDSTQFGFHAMILSSSSTIYIDPYSRIDTSHYLVYNKQDYSRPAGPFVEHEPLGDNSEVEALVAALHANGGSLPSGDELRTYRLAVAATGEYTIFHGGTVPAGMAAIVTAMNRVNGVYERDMALRMVLVANNDLVVYTNPATDPYTNSDGGAMLFQNQTNLDNVIGNANYDIGHVFSTGGGGVAFLAVPCQTGDKAKGVTGLPQPIGDPFYIDYVAHEMGHQWGANHTFNGNAGACAGGNRNGSTAYEPGSGTTIMAYAGICGNQDIQPNSDDDFHTISFDEIRAYTVQGSGNTCAVTTQTGNSAPTVDAGANYTIPINTPFVLTGSGSDVDGDPLTYDWEEFDLGPAGHPDTPSGNAPIFRSFVPVTETFRIFPQISDIVNNTHTIGELLPSYSRVMNFRLTARDNHVSPSAGGVNYDGMQVTVSNAAGPFLVTYPNTAVTWNAGEIETVTWNVANTNQSPVNCTNVDIKLSTDGGYTYPTIIEAGVANDGAEAVIVPFMATTQARVQVMCAGNVFFDISNANFTIVAVNQAVLHVDKSVSAAGLVSPGDALTYTIAVSNTGNITATTAVTDTFPAGLINPVCNGVPGDLMITVDLSPLELAQFECTAEVEPTLAVQIEKSVDQEVVEAGTAVTYTITVTNANAITLTNVVVNDPDVGNCSPELGTPIILSPATSQSYICANNVLTSTTINTATVTAEIELSNTAVASAPEAPNSPVTSTPVLTTVNMAASATVIVIVNQAVLHVDKNLLTTGPLLPGDALTYTIAVSNTGNITATTAVTDTFPAGLINPVCNGVPGDLTTTIDLDPLALAQFECTAEVEPTLAVQIAKSVDEEMVEAGTAVTYTITITNGNAITLTNVVVNDPGVGSCSPALGSPITLAPAASQSYICANNIITSTTINTATVTADIELSNTAEASAPEAPDSPVTSIPVLVTVNVAASATATVTLIIEPQYTLYLPVILRDE